MIFLIFKMFVYLLLAAGIGGAAGWLSRNLVAQQKEENAQRQVHDAKSKMPQLESLLRGRDEQIEKLKKEIKDRKIASQEDEKKLREMEQALLEEKRETNKWKQTAEAGKPLEMVDGEDDSADEMIAALSAEITALKAELDVREVPQVVRGSENEAKLLRDLEDSRNHASQMERYLSAARQDLDRARTNVQELERERELQNKSLKVLHQQLELERSRSGTAN